MIQPFLCHPSDLDAPTVILGDFNARTSDRPGHTANTAQEVLTPLRRKDQIPVIRVRIQGITDPYDSCLIHGNGHVLYDLQLPGEYLQTGTKPTGLVVQAKTSSTTLNGSSIVDHE